MDPHVLIDSSFTPAIFILSIDSLTSSLVQHMLCAYNTHSCIQPSELLLVENIVCWIIKPVDLTVILILCRYVN